jgi:hypothetical protein
MRADAIRGAKRDKPARRTRPDRQAQRRPDLAQRDSARRARNELWSPISLIHAAGRASFYFAFVIEAFSHTTSTEPNYTVLAEPGPAHSREL